ncbi:MAG: class I SAM-dependent methyltransferase [Longimicrobiales bacterium]
MARAVSQRLAEDYSSTAEEYARLWGPVILPMGLPLLAALPLDECRRVIDLGTGVGAVLPHLQAKAPKAQICGVDYAEGMLRIAQGRHSSLAVMDAQQLAIRSRAFDVAVLMFVLFHCPDPARALAEVRRILQGSGSVGLTTWSHDPGLPGADIWTEELDRCGADPDPRHPSVRQHELVDTPEKVSRLLEGVGFNSIRIWTERFEQRWDHESLVLLQQGCGVARRRLASLAPDAREECAARVREQLREIPIEALVWTPAVLYAVAAVAE